MPKPKVQHCHQNRAHGNHLLQEKEENKKLKQKQRDRMQPKVGKLDIDYQVLHDAFFKHQTKPHLTRLGEIYYEGKEFEARVCHCPFLEMGIGCNVSPVASASVVMHSFLDCMHAISCPWDQTMHCKTPPHL